MADKCGLTEQAINYLERGKHEPRSKTVFKVCLGMGMSYQDICRIACGRGNEHGKLKRR